MLARFWKWMIGDFSFCNHVWDLKHVTAVYEEKSNGEKGALPVGNKYLMHCQKCGEIKTKKDY